MPESYRALCSDFYINQKLSLKLDLPRERQTVLDLFDRVRRQYPAMSQFRRYKDEVALESEAASDQNRWVAIRTNNIRSGTVNPAALADAYALHSHVLDVAPFFLSISPLDVDFLELLYGFDIQTERSQDEVVYEALLAHTPLAALLDMPDARVTDCQPLYTMSVKDEQGEIEVSYEVKTRSAGRGGRGDEPISVYLTLRRFAPVAEIRQLPGVLSAMARLGEELVDGRAVPHLVVPIRDAAGGTR
jgi:hypothetical protein